MPWTISSFTLRQLKPGKSYASCGADRAPCDRANRAPISSSSAVVRPGRTAGAHVRDGSRDELADSLHCGEIGLRAESHR